MGGRTTRDKMPESTDRWKFVSTLSDTRLTNYLVMIQSEGREFRKDGNPRRSPEAFEGELLAERKRRIDTGIWHKDF
ncbi:hypothetical protein LZT27_16660 [Aeromonas veronii]|uniref:hypothetical protein n=1 Tax=Aeromonas veronii TaxID=654 RepID=UPI002363D91E|nr:hypothetical protein [Aeromonas veronii]MDD1846222.1 hypothetical protein [Aeromonas veronii]